MTTTANKINKRETVFSLSVNIIRDADVALNYIPTPNARQVFNQLINDYQTGIRSFNIVGAYGTGKSSFLWAFEKNINQKQDYFSPLNGTFRALKEFEFFRFVGEFGSLIQAFAKRFGVNRKDFTTEELIQHLDKYYKSLQESSKGLVILVDEFGKILEYAAKNNPENELYFIQQMAEYVNDSKKNIFFVTTLHQDFNGYARGLTKTQQNEWDKVKGRLKEITFNEPVEQLLFLASKKLTELNIGKKDKNFSRLFKSIEVAKAFPLKDYFSESFAEKLLPFDILSSAILTLALQKYGQNERSLFSFIESNDNLGIKDFNLQKAPYYNLSSVYDYLIHNYYSFLTTKYNPHYTQWAAIRTALERTEGLLNENLSDAHRLVKSIGLLNIFASASARINKDFLSDYGKYSLGVNEPERIIKALEGLKIVRFVKHSNKYILFEGTDLDIELAIDDAGNLVERVTNVVHHLNQYFDFPYISAKAAYYERGTPRFFAFHLSEIPEQPPLESEIDGFINLVFSDSIKEKEIREASEKCEEAILYGWYKNTNEIRNLIFEVEKINKVRENHFEDRVAVRELESILQHQIKLLNHYVLGNIYSEQSPVIWYFKGERKKITDQKSLNQLLSKICEDVYPYTPVYRNEMVNKTKISGVIATARKNFVKALVENWSKRDLGFEEGKFPPEKTIYLSLLRETGIHRESIDGFILGDPTNEDFELSPLWQECESFLKSTCQGKRNLHELTDRLLSRPFKLKKGFLDFWLLAFLFVKREDFALFGKDDYIPFLSAETLDLVSREPADYEIKAFDIEGVKLNLFNRYRSLLNQTRENKPSGKSFIETIRPFLIFYKQLPEYAKNTKRLSKKTLALREAIAYAKDPEESFFENFPKALGYNIVQLQKSQNELEAYVHNLEISIREIRTCYEELVNRAETFLLEEIIGEKLNFPNYKIVLQGRFKSLKKHLLLPYQKVFHQRVMSELDDRKSWLNSIAQASIGKSLDVISDEDEKLLYEKLKDIVHELDNLCEISKSGFDEIKEIAFKLEITSFVEGLKKNLVRLPKSKNKELVQLQSVIKTKLSNDKQLNIATLTKLLEELLRNEK